MYLIVIQLNKWINTVYLYKIKTIQASAIAAKKTAKHF